MRRKDIEVTDRREILGILSRRRVMHVGINGPDYP